MVPANDPLALSGVWRFRELLPFAPPEMIATVGEGQTLLQRADAVGRYVGLNPGRLFLQYEGLNPSGSFKDNGMTAAFTHARLVGANRAACASTGNTSSSLRLYCAATGLMAGVVFVGNGKIAYGKLAQALRSRRAYAANHRRFRRCHAACPRSGPEARHLPGQQCQSVPARGSEGDHVPGAGSAELGSAGLDRRARRQSWQLSPRSARRSPSCAPRVDRSLAAIRRHQCRGANTFFELFESRALRWDRGSPNQFVIDEYYGLLEREGRKAATLASAIEINRPVNLPKALRALETCGGVVRAVTDQDILDAKAQVGAGGFGCEPASAASVAGVKLLTAEGVSGPTNVSCASSPGTRPEDPSATVNYHLDSVSPRSVTGAKWTRAIRQSARARGQRPGSHHSRH